MPEVQQVPMYHPLKDLVGKGSIVQKHRRHFPVHPKYTRRRVFWSGLFVFIASAAAVFGLGLLYGARIEGILKWILIIFLVVLATVLILTADVRYRRSRKRDRDQSHHFWNGPHNS